MAAANSLSNTRDFGEVYRSGQRARRDGITVFARRRDEDGPARVGLSIPGRVGGAVVRNRIKRRLRAALADCRVPDRLDLVIRADEDLSKLAFTDVAGHMSTAV